jgi:hypothetical protein
VESSLIDIKLRPFPKGRDFLSIPNNYQY